VYYQGVETAIAARDALTRFGYALSDTLAMSWRIRELHTPLQTYSAWSLRSIRSAAATSKMKDAADEF
jgi:hypothetical protein